MQIKYEPRQLGKSMAQHMAVEAALDAGKRVMVASAGKTEIRKRTGHLTRITLCEDSGLKTLPARSYPYAD